MRRIDHTATRGRRRVRLLTALCAALALVVGLPSAVVAQGAGDDADEDGAAPDAGPGAADAGDPGADPGAADVGDPGDAAGDLDAGDAPAPEGDAAAGEGALAGEGEAAAGDEALRAAIPAPSELELQATNQRLREIGTQVDELKEDTFGTKTRLLLLRESVLRRSIAGSKVIVVHNDDMGSEYELVQVLYVLDRERQLNRMDYDNGVEDLNGQVVIDEKLLPGSHILTVKMVYKGAEWGIFRYMDGYTFTIESSYAFTAEEAKVHEIAVSAIEGGDFFTPLEERPTIRYNLRTHSFQDVHSPVAEAID